MEKVINLGIPHVGEQIFRSFGDKTLIQWTKLCSTWNVIAGNVLYERWKHDFFEAYKTDKIDIVRIFLERCDSEDNQLNTKGRDGVTPFTFACRNGRSEIVKLLLHYSDVKNIDLNVTDDVGYNGFISACINGHQHIVKLLLEHTGKREIDFNAKIVHHEYGKVLTAGHYAFLHSGVEIVELLREYADIKGIDIPTRKIKHLN